MNDDKTNHYLSETYKHIKRVRYFLDILVIDLIKRGQEHDNTKLQDPEKTIFAEHTFTYQNLEFGSKDYEKLMEIIEPAIKYHHSKNRHHPEYWKNGIDDMTLVDLVEMICDWRAATEKNKNGCITKSLEINSKKFKMSPQLKKIFENTIDEYFK